MHVLPCDQLRSGVPESGERTAAATGPRRRERAGCAGAEPSGAFISPCRSKSQTLAYIDTFMVLAVAAGIMFLLVVYRPQERPRARGQVVVE